MIREINIYSLLFILVSLTVETMSNTQSID